MRRTLSGIASHIWVAALLLVLSGSLPAVAAPGEVAASGTGTASEIALHQLSEPSIDSNAVTMVSPKWFDGREPQLVVEPDTRMQVTDTTVEPFRKIVQFIAIDEDAGVGQRCTGSFIGPGVILTASHCVWNPNIGGYPDTVEVIPARNGDVAPYGSEFAVNVWVPEPWIESLSDGDLLPDWNYEYALVLMSDDQLSSLVGAMTIGVLDDEALNANGFNPTTAGYPSDKPLGTMWVGSQPGFTGVNPTHLFHVIDAMTGQSGSPLWRAADELIVGIESLETDTDNVALRITQRVVDDFDAVCEVIGCSFNVADGNPPPPPVDQADFQPTWQRTDWPVAEGEAIRTWIWGPSPFTNVFAEIYDEGPGGERYVLYYDKSRMEITNPAGDPGSIWYVTNGLLATELISGRMQVGDNRFIERTPAVVNVAGDAADPNGPTYASFTGVLDRGPQPVGMLITERINRSGIVVADQTLVAQGVTIGNVDTVTNHSIAAPFWNFMNSSGAVYENGAFISAQLFENAYFATGRPISEPYWADVLVGGTSKLVLVQCFERRCLTYTPDNAPEWRVEMSNIGQHYYSWRYEEANEPAPPPVDVCLDEAESAFYDMINAYRATQGLAPLSNSATLNQVAYDHSLDMGERGYFDHITPEGLGPEDRAAAAGYPGMVMENLAAGSGEAVEILEVWQDNPDTDVILLSDAVVVGIGRVYIEDSPWEWYWTAQFGNVADSPPAGC